MIDAVSHDYRITLRLFSPFAATCAVAEESVSDHISNETGHDGFRRDLVESRSLEI